MKKKESWFRYPKRVKRAEHQMSAYWIKEYLKAIALERKIREA